MKSLISFLVVQYGRTLGAMGRHFGILREIFEDVFEEVVHEAERMIQSNVDFCRNMASRQDVDWRSELFPDMPVSIELDVKRGGIKGSLPLNRQTFLANIPRISRGAVGRAFRSMDWRILEFQDGIELPTSDNPVVVFGVNVEGEVFLDVGLCQNHVDVITPLDPSHVLFTEVGLPLGQIEPIEADERLADLFRRAIVANASAHIYSFREDGRIPQIRNRVVDADAATELARVRANWGKGESDDCFETE